MLPKSFGQKSNSANQSSNNNKTDSSWDDLRAFMPTSFGKQEKKKDMSSVFETTKRQVKKLIPFHRNT